MVSGLIAIQVSTALATRRSFYPARLAHLTFVDRRNEAEEADIA
jgi:hypothetical protein